MRQRLSPRQKAAILLISIGQDTAAELFKFMSETEVELVSLEIARNRQVPAEDRDTVIEEFLGMAVIQQYSPQGGLLYAQELLERTMGPERAKSLVDRLMQSMQVRPFEFVRKADPAQMQSFLQNEHSQTIALIMAYMPPETAAVVLASLPPERQADVARRIAIMESTSPEVIKEVERVLERQLSSLVRDDYTSAGGVEAVVDVLNRSDRTTERVIMESLMSDDPALADEIKKRMFVFEDIVQLDDRSVQRVLRDVDMARDMPMALKVGSDEVRKKVFGNVSKRAVDNLKEAMEFLGPVRLRDVEQAQARIVQVIRKLEEDGEIVIARGGGDVIVG